MRAARSELFFTLILAVSPISPRATLPSHSDGQSRVGDSGPLLQAPGTEARSRDGDGDDLRPFPA